MVSPFTAKMNLLFRLAGAYPWQTSTITYGFYTSISQLSPSYAAYPNAPRDRQGGTHTFQNSFLALTASESLYIESFIANRVIGFLPQAVIFSSNPAAAQITFGGLNYAGELSNDDDIDAFTFRLDGGSSELRGDVWLLSTARRATNEALFRDTVAHEIGHSLGLLDVGADPGLADLESHDTQRFSMMATTRDELLNRASEFQLYDVASLQAMYGRDDDHRSGATVYTLNGDIIDALTGLDRQYALWDGGGIDTLDLTGSTGLFFVDLRPGRFSTIGNGANAVVTGGEITNLGRQNISLAFGTHIENATGSAQADGIIGNDFTNVLRGAGGDDVIYGDRSQIENAALAGPADEYRKVQQGGTLSGSVPDPMTQSDTIEGGAGNDRLYGSLGHDWIEGGDHNDTLIGGLGDDVLSGDAGDDILKGGLGYNYLYGGDGYDVVDYSDLDVGITFHVSQYQPGDIPGFGVTTSTGVNDYIQGIERLVGTLQSDVFRIMGRVPDGVTLEIVGNGGTDIVNLRDADEGVEVTIFADRSGLIRNAAGERSGAILLDQFIGNTSGSDHADDIADLSPTTGNAIFGYDGDDVLRAHVGSQLLMGDDGDDHIRGGPGGDALYGGVGNDTFYFELGDLPASTSQEEIEIIRDIDAGDRIIWNGHLLTGGPLRLIDGEVRARYVFNDIFFQYNDEGWLGPLGEIYCGPPSGTGTLSITLPDGTRLRVENWTNGEAGIRLFGVRGWDTNGYWSNIVENGVFGDYQNLLGRAEAVSQRGPHMMPNSRGTDGDDLLAGGGPSGGGAPGPGNPLSSPSGDDLLEGLDGNDVIQPGGGSDTVRGGTGFDIVSYGDAPAAVFVTLVIQGMGQNTGGSGVDTLVDVEGVSGSMHADSLFGDTAANRLEGRAGDDTLNGGGAADTLNGGAGADTFVLSQGSHSLASAPDVITDFVTGQDKLNLTGLALSGAAYVLVQQSANGSIVLIDADANGDFETKLLLSTSMTASDLVGAGVGITVVGDAAAQILNGGALADALNGGGGNDTVSGAAGGDSLYGLEGDDRLYGQDGNDYAYGGSGADQLLGGAGADALLGEGGNDQVFGETGGDVLYGGDGGDVLWGGADGDTLLGQNGADTLHGEDGADQLFGDAPDIAGADTLYGGAGADTLYGGGEGDTLYGGDGGDTLSGEDGGDVLIGGAGGDILTGGAGGDLFLYQATGDSNNAAYDLIVDLNTAVDVLSLAQIDANSTLAGDQAFTVVTAPGALAIGQLRLTYDSVNNRTLLEADNDGVAGTDLVILINGNVAAGGWLGL